MALCDELEEKKEKRNKYRVRANEASLDKLLNAKEPEEFAEHWQRVVGNIELCKTASEVKLFRRFSMGLAVTGRLGTQCPEDRTVSSLLERIEEARTNKLKAGVIKNQKLPRSLSEEEVPHKLPDNWEWVRVSSLGEVQLGRQRAPQYHSGSNMKPYLRVANVFEDRIDVSDVKEMHFSEADYETFRLQAGDILLNEGQSAELVGRSAIYRDEVPGACFQNTLIRFRPYLEEQVEYMQLVFLYYLYSGRFRAASKQTTNIAHLGAGRFADLEFPLPPLEEQSRIKAKLLQIHRLCRTWESSLMTSHRVSEFFAKSVSRTGLREGALTDS